LTEVKGCFVTLKLQGRLRGCIGHLEPQEPLYRAVMENARDAALRDHRFEPLEAPELSEVGIEISVLTTAQPLAFVSSAELLRQLCPHRDGVVLKLAARRSATFLPQVWEQISDKVEFLDRLAVKAGGEASDWREPGTKVSIYQVEAFSESDFPPDTTFPPTGLEPYA
jgi:AmmeMemoRadiSam system protein A